MRHGPRTTTEIVEAFPHLSRFGVMQHLDVLREAAAVADVRGLMVAAAVLLWGRLSAGRRLSGRRGDAGPLQTVKIEE